MIFGEVRRYAVNTRNRERNLLSVGPKHHGYEVLAASAMRTDWSFELPRQCGAGKVTGELPAIFLLTGV